MGVRTRGLEKRIDIESQDRFRQKSPSPNLYQKALRVVSKFGERSSSENIIVYSGSRLIIILSEFTAINPTVIIHDRNRIVYNARGPREVDQPYIAGDWEQELDRLARKAHYRSRNGNGH